MLERRSEGAVTFSGFWDPNTNLRSPLTVIDLDISATPQSET